jgi:DNA repair exonuclease SbcCD ATPase subunit
LAERSNPLEPPAGVPEDQLDRLYHGPLEEFTAGRNALAKELRDQDEREAAGWAKALPKPTGAAWLVNQLVARKPREVKRLLEAASKLRELQGALLEGDVDQGRLRKAAAREREAAAALSETAQALGREHKVGPGILDRVAETLQAAAADPEVARAIELGRLAREQRATGFGAAVAAPAGAKPARKTGKADQARERAAAEKRRKGAERKLAAAEKQVERRRAAVEKARGALESAEQELEQAEDERSKAERELKSL